MLRTLYGRMAVVLLGLLIFLGAIGLAVTLALTDRWEQEVTQRLNRGLAASLVAERVLMVDGQVNEAALAKVFSTLSLINPSIECYLLDLEGRVVTHSGPEGEVRRTRLDVAPIKAFLAKGSELPILGDDPRDPGRRKVFSASPIMVEDRYEGYLYIVLQGERRASIAGRLLRNHVLSLGVTASAAALVVALLAGLYLFRRLTRPLRSLTRGVEAFRGSDFSEPGVAELPTGDASGDEIARLSAAFSAMADRIIEQVQRLRHTDTMRRELVANVSHDLRTPLATLQGYLETLDLKDSSLSVEERREFLAVATAQGERLARLVEELFELARLESTEMHPEIEPFSIAELVQDVVQEFRLAAEAKGVTLSARLPAEVPTVAADIGLMQRVLQNLIGNAVAHTEEGGSVTVGLVVERGRVVVRVEDTGCGIPSGELEHVFDRFYRASTGEQPRPRGGGLGLAIVKKILELHGSAIEAVSAVDAGTTFSFALPAML